MAADQYTSVLSSYNKLYFPNNEAASFKNIVSNEIVVGDQYEVALIELSLQHDFQIDSDDCRIFLFDFLASDDQGKSFGKYHDLTLNKKSINSGLDVVNELNNLLYKNVQRLKDRDRAIFYWGTNERVWVRFKEAVDYITVVLRKGTLQLVGAATREDPIDAIIVGKNKDALTFIGPDGKTCKFAEDCHFTLTSEAPVADFFELPPIIDNAPSEFTVLSNLASESEVAGYKVNLLRFCSLDPKTGGKRVSLRYGADPVYVPLADTNINEIAIELRSLNSRLLSLNGHVRALLHIRRKR